MIRSRLTICSSSCLTFVLIWHFVGNAFVIQIVINYDINIVCHILLQVFFHLNLVKATIELVTIEDGDLFFGRVVSSDDVIMSTLKNDLQLFQQLLVQLTKIKNTFLWWANHAMQFLHVFFLVPQVLSIVRFQIKIE